MKHTGQNLSELRSFYWHEKTLVVQKQQKFHNVFFSVPNFLWDQIWQKTNKRKKDWKFDDQIWVPLSNLT